MNVAQIEALGTTFVICEVITSLFVEMLHHFVRMPRNLWVLLHSSPPHTKKKQFCANLITFLCIS